MPLPGRDNVKLDARQATEDEGGKKQRKDAGQVLSGREQSIMMQPSVENIVRPATGSSVSEPSSRDFHVGHLGRHRDTRDGHCACPRWTPSTPEHRSAHEHRLHRTIVQGLRPSLSPR